MKGFNKADAIEKFRWYVQTKGLKSRPCVFLSHKSEDKPACKKIAEYLADAEIDYYLDEIDDALQRAVSAGDPALITESIKKGIRESSHMLIIVSEKTFTSPWVAFEVGYGHSAIIDKTTQEEQLGDKMKLAVLTLKDLSEKRLPDFMETAFVIKGTNSLNEYILHISQRNEKSLTGQPRVIKNSTINHPLDDVLNWKL